MVEGDGHLYDAEAIAKRTEGLARPEKWGQLPVAVYMQFDGEADHAFLSRWRCQGWVAAEFRAHVKQDLDCCSFRKNSVPVQLLHFRSSNCTTIRQGTYEEFSCPLKQWGCRVLYRVVRIYPGKDNLQFVAVYRTSNGAHTHFDSYEKSVHAGVTIDGRTKAHIRTLLSLRMSRPLDIARGLLTLGVPPKFVPSTRRIARYTQNHRDVLGNGLRNCLAGLVAEYKEHHYYSESVLGGNTSAHTGYVIPGADIGLWTTTNFSLLYTSDSLCRIAVENLKLKHGGWLGIDGKHRTNYCGFPLVPLVVTDSARRHFVVAICLMSDEFKWRVARAVRQFTLWLQTRFPLRVEDLPTVDLGDDEPEDDDGAPQGNGLAAALLEGLDAHHMVHGVRGESPSLELFPAGALAFEYACADNADGYGFALTANGSKVGNDPVHMLRNLYLPRKGLWNALAEDVRSQRGRDRGIPTKNDISYIFALLKLLILIPPLRKDPITQADNDTLFHAGVELFVAHMRALHFNTFASHFEEYYTGQVVHRRGNWGHCCFPHFCAHHTSGVESVNAIIEEHLKGHHFKEAVLFAAEIRAFLRTMGMQYASDEAHCFQHSPSVFQDVPTWKKAERLKGDKQMVLVADGGYLMSFGRPANGRRLLVVSRELINSVESVMTYENAVKHFKSLADTYYRLISDPTSFAEEVDDLHVYLRWAVRSFYVLHDFGLEQPIHRCMTATCTCPFFLKKWYCKHAVCLFLKEHYDRVPAEMVRASHPPNTPAHPPLLLRTPPADSFNCLMCRWPGIFPTRGAGWLV